jgi:hypothetical protein
LLLAGQCLLAGLRRGALTFRLARLRLSDQLLQLALRLRVQRVLLVDGGLGGHLLVTQLLRLGLGVRLRGVEVADLDLEVLLAGAELVDQLLLQVRGRREVALALADLGQVGGVADVGRGGRRAVDVRVDRVLLQLFAAARLLLLGRVDLRLRLGDLDDDAVELDLRAVRLLGGPLDLTIELADLGCDGFRLRPLVASAPAWSGSPTRRVATTPSATCARGRRRGEAARMNDRE